MRKKQKSLLFVFGTRPEVIKLAPVIRAFEEDGTVRVNVCVTAQHREMMDQFLLFFRLRPNVDLNLMTHDQTLAELTSQVMSGCSSIYRQYQPDMVFVQGDTSSAFAAAMAASLAGIPVAHVEAGLRSYNKDSPFPEEINRILIGHLAELHFAHTESAGENLKREGITKGVFVVGNTSVDALKLVLRTIEQTGEQSYYASFSGIDFGRKLILVTLHRRESHGIPLTQTCLAIRQIAYATDIEMIYPVHLNPRVRQSVFNILSGIANVHLLDPLGYSEFVWIMSKASLVITDSGGVVEEAATLGIPILLAREATERAEAVSAGHATMVGYDVARIVRTTSELLELQVGKRELLFHNVFGDGMAAQRILEITKQHLNGDRSVRRESELVAGAQV